MASQNTASTIELPRSKVNWLFELVQFISVRGWFTIWLATILFSAIGYLILSLTTEAHGVVSSNPEKTVGFPDCLYFSLVTITTLGFGDLAPLGVSRLIAVVEAVIGVFVVGALVSKVLSKRTEMLILEINELAFQERIARILSSVHFLLSEFQSICMEKQVEQAAVNQEMRRMDNAIGTLTHSIKAIDELIIHQKRIDPDTMRIILASMRNTLEEYRDSRQRMSSLGKIELPNEALLPDSVGSICGRCMKGYSGEVKRSARQVNQLVESVAGISSSDSQRD